MLDGLLARPGAKARLAAAEWQNALHKMFVFCCIWALSASLSVSDCGVDQSKLFSDWWRQHWRSSSDVRIGGNANKNIAEYFLDVDSTSTTPLRFEPWQKNNHFFYPVQFDSKTTMVSSVMVPTSDTCSVAFWLDLLVRRHKAVMLAGAAGTGKTQLLSGVLRRLGGAWMSTTINFNYFTTSDGMAWPVLLLFCTVF